MIRGIPGFLHRSGLAVAGSRPISVKMQTGFFAEVKVA